MKCPSCGSDKGVIVDKKPYHDGRLIYRCENMARGAHGYRSGTLLHKFDKRFIPRQSVAWVEDE